MSKSMFPEEAFGAGVVFDFFKPRSPDVREKYLWGASMTRQEFADDCDINTIMSRYEVTGVLPQVAGQPAYGDYIGVPNLMEALNAMTDAQTAFMALPAKVRKEFDNDPTEFVAFASDPENIDQMRSWGLAPPAPAEPAQAVIPPAPAPEPVPAPVAPKPA